MTIDEAIEHAKEVARTCDDSECAAEHMQLAEWLRQARGATKAARWYTARIGELEDKNDKLRELVRKYGEYTDQDRCEGCVCKSRCNDGDIDECWQLTEILARELGIGVSNDA